MCVLPSFSKVVGNAIRTVGHLFHAISLSSLESQELEQLQTLCIDVTVNLAARINVALVDMDNNNLNTRSWKQRNFAKKHAWGSCNSLASLLLFCNAFGSDKCQVSCAVALISVIDCIKQADVLNEKIACCALSTLLLMNKEIWQWNCLHKPVLGLCLANCLYQYYQQVRLNSYI